MIFTYFPPGPIDLSISAEEQVRAHARQTKPDGVHDLNLLELFDWIYGASRDGRKGDAGYIIAGDCRSSRRAAHVGPAGFALIDLDDAPPDWVQLNQYQGFAWTTPKHTPEHPHWRVVIPFTEPVAHGALECPFPGGHIRNRSQPAFLPTGSPEWVVLDGASQLDASALSKPKAKPKERTVAPTQLAELDEKIVQDLAEVWKRGCQGEHAFGGLGGMLRARGVSDPRISAIALRLADVVESTHPDPEGRMLDDSNPEGRPTLQARLSSDADPARVVLVLDSVEELISASVPGFIPPEEKPVTPRGWLTWGDIVKPQPPRVWLCKDLQLGPGRPAAFVTPPAGGKTWTIQALAMAVATGQDVFGRFPCTECPVLHISTDSGQYDTVEKYQLLARGMKIKKDPALHVWPHDLVCVDRFGRFDPAKFKPIVDKAKETNAGLVILDSLFAIAAGLDMMAPEAAGPLRYTRDLLGITWVWVMHTPKTANVAFGSQAIKSAAGVMWTVEDANPGKRWSCAEKHAEGWDESGRLSFVTDWEKDVDAVGTVLGRRITAREDEGEAPQEAESSVCQKIQYDMLRLVGLRGKASYTELIAEGGAPKGTTGRAKRRAVAVLNVLCRPSGGMLVGVEGERYILAPGVIVPPAPHHLECLVRDKDL